MFLEAEHGVSNDLPLTCISLHIKLSWLQSLGEEACNEQQALGLSRGQIQPQASLPSISGAETKGLMIEENHHH